MRACLRLAWRLAYSPDARQRWRQLSVSLCCCLAVLLSLLAVGVMATGSTADAVIAARSPIWSASGDGRLEVSLRGLTIDGNQFPVVWLNPVAGFEDDPRIVPPGLQTLPAPGEAVLSPGLVDLGYTAADFGLKPSGAGEGPGGSIGASGIISASDLWIYARPTADRTLGTGGALLLLDGYGLPGERAGLETWPDVPRFAEAVLMGLWLLIFPGALLTLSGARAMSEIRTNRADILTRLGIRTTTVRALLAAETAALALAGALAALVLWFVALRHLTQVPLTGSVLLPGSLDISPVRVLWVSLAVVTLTTAAGAWVRPGRALARRARPLRAWHSAPMVLGLLLMALSQMFTWGDPRRQVLLFGGLLLTFATLPMAMPVLVSRLGRILARTRSAPIWLAGRRLAASPWSLARPATMVGLLVFIAGGAYALYAQMTSVEIEQQGERVALFSVDWRDARPGDVEFTQEALTGVQVLPVTQTASGEAVVIDNCSTAASIGMAIGIAQPCVDDRLSPTFVEGLRRSTSLSAVIDDGTIEPLDSTVVVIDSSAGDAITGQEIMQALAGILPAVNISPMVSDPHPPKTVGWLVAGWVLASMVLTLAMCREVGDRTLASLVADHTLVRLGMSQPEIVAIQRWSLLFPVAAAIPLGYVGAVAFAIMGHELGYTIRTLGPITIVAGFAATMALAVMATTFALQRVQHDRSEP